MINLLRAPLTRDLGTFSLVYPLSYPQLLWKINLGYFMTPERYQRIISVLNQRQPDLTVIADEVHKGRNIAAIIRSSDAVGIDTIHSVIPKAGYQWYQGTALGSQKWVEVIQHPTVTQPISQLKEQGFQIVAAHLSDDAIDYREVDYTKPTALLLGTEKEGVSDEALDLVDQNITVPMLGMVKSLNVSVACAIILAEVRQQREQAGLYSQARLPKAIYENRLFRWCQPTVATFCEENNLSYPELDEEGEVVDAPGWYRWAREQIAKASAE